MSAEELLPCPFCGETANALQSGRVESYGDWIAGCDNEQCMTQPEVLAATKIKAIAAWNRRTPPAMNADHIGDASPAVTEVNKLIQSPLVEKLVGALKRLATATERLMAAWPDTHVPGGKLCVEVSEALNDAKALAHIPDAGNMIAPVEAVAWRVKDYADGWILFHHEAPARKSGEARNGALVQPLYTHPAPIKPSGDTGELRDRVARVIGDRKGHFVSKPWGEDYELADAILDLIQSERAG